MVVSFNGFSSILDKRSNKREIKKNEVKCRQKSPMMGALTDYHKFDEPSALSSKTSSKITNWRQLMVHLTDHHICDGPSGRSSVRVVTHS